ncbi:MAG: endonuclease MutS2, partial [Bacteroidales bacterium]|nr:endonuclease MutS2 [Bacteroidales bacterium]
MTIDRRLEEKLGFDKVRALLSGRCSTDYALQRIAEETFSTKATEIRKRLLLTDEMRLIAMFEETFPTTGYIDALPFLVPLEKDGSSIDLLSLGKLKTLLDTVRRLVHFFSSIKDGIYPNLKRFSAKVMTFPEVLRRIDTILDKFGEVKDTASDELYAIRKSIRDKESALSKRAAALLRKAIDEGLADADAALSVRDGKLLIPINSSSKRKMPGFVHDTSATGKTTFVEPAEVIEIQNEISELHFAETREIARILYAFSEFVRPYVPDLEQAATYLGEMDFLMA